MSDSRLNLGKKGITIPQYLLITILTIFSIGPQYFLNLSYTVNQLIIQNGLDLSTHEMLIPSTLSNLAFALGVPVGRVLSKKYGVRAIYLTFITTFLLGTLVDVFSVGLYTLIAGRTIQGLSAGVLFLTILPVKLVSFPSHIRNLFLFFVISGLFGSSAVGAFFGSLSLSTDAWRWIFVLNISFSLLCLLIGFAILPKPEQGQRESYRIDKTGVFILTLVMVVLAIPLINLQEQGFNSLYVWPFLVLSLVLIILFVYIDWHVENPLIPFRALWTAKSVSGTVMAVASHLALIVALAGINGFLRNIMDIPFLYLSHFYLCFFGGIVLTAILSTVFYDKWGAGFLGIIGSLLVIYVGIEWRMVQPEISLSTLYVQVACLGSGVSMVLVSGALGTALAGDLHYASMRSVSLHFIRNMLGAVAAPILGWYGSRQSAIHYENIRATVSETDPEVKAELTQMVHQLLSGGHPVGEAKELAFYTVAVNAKKAAGLGSYHDLFTIFLILGAIMLVASIGKVVTGKGRALVKKEKRLLLSAAEHDSNAS